ncbi:hypothetical protein ANN_10968, partial [Periplaneta americana]
MAGLWEGGNEPSGSLKVIYNRTAVLDCSVRLSVENCQLGLNNVWRASVLNCSSELTVPELQAESKCMGTRGGCTIRTAELQNRHLHGPAYCTFVTLANSTLTFTALYLAFEYKDDTDVSLHLLIDSATQ